MAGTSKKTAKPKRGAASKAEGGKASKASKAPSKAMELLGKVKATMNAVPFNGGTAGVTLQVAALTTLDANGYPTTRTMHLDYVADDLTQICMNTRRGTRKQEEIARNNKASLHFQDPRGRGGWATLKGEAELRAGGDENDVQIVFRPVMCEVVSYVEQAMKDEAGFLPSTLVRSSAQDGWRVQ